MIGNRLRWGAGVSHSAYSGHRTPRLCASGKGNWILMLNFRDSAHSVKEIPSMDALDGITADSFRLIAERICAEESIFKRTERIQEYHNKELARFQFQERI